MEEEGYRGWQGMRDAWTDADHAALCRLYPVTATRDVAAQLGRTERAVYQRAEAYGIRKSPEYLASPAAARFDGRDCGRRFAKGLTPWNAGKRGWQAGGRSVQTQFKAGQRTGAASRNHRPVGSELETKDGIVLRKVSDTGDRRTDWRPVHVLLWESAHGPVPAGHIVVFADRNRRNFTLSNLELVTRAENMRRNSYLTRYPKDVADVIRLRGALNRKITNRSKRA